MEYSIQEIARAAGTTSRTLRHYDALGLVRPTRVGHNGYRYYDDRSLVRLQRVLLLRELGLGLDRIAEVLAAQDAGSDLGGTADAVAFAEARVLDAHLGLLEQERARIDRQIGAVRRTIAALTTQHEGNGLMEANMFDGFDHTKHKEEVIERWGENAYAKSDSWWRSMSAEQQQGWQDQVAALNADWVTAMNDGEDPTSERAQALAERHAKWLRGVPGAPTGEAFEHYVRGLGEMYVADERFAANYGGAAGATLVRDALHAYLDGAAGEETLGG
ncbi:MerR family transcriptional regulator [Leucobacter aridicollis]|uniref:MerR family transcriptional regulator n=1 Tax=Leucobacter aridicollis TaxID=283878 RepID=UPI002102F39C|nr:TipAS antibiotic-recognition domain-containing protein [Leucobacter aridicollis]UTX54905.1 TipAS antibiotic-recognition domain-containing protein [Leucobacter aridicollis]